MDSNVPVLLVALLLGLCFGQAAVPVLLSGGRYTGDRQALGGSCFLSVAVGLSVFMSACGFSAWYPALDVYTWVWFHVMLAYFVPDLLWVWLMMQAVLLQVP